MCVYVCVNHENMMVLCRDEVLIPCIRDKLKLSNIQKNTQGLFNLFFIYSYKYMLRDCSDNNITYAER